jgi:hypothetical protein
MLGVDAVRRWGSTSISTTTSKRYLLVTVVGHVHHHNDLCGRQHRLQTRRQWATAVLVLRERKCFWFWVIWFWVFLFWVFGWEVVSHCCWLVGLLDSV